MKINDDREHQRRVFSSHCAGRCRVVGSLMVPIHVAGQLTVIEREPIRSSKLEGGARTPAGQPDGDPFIGLSLKSNHLKALILDRTEPLENKEVENPCKIY